MKKISSLLLVLYGLVSFLLSAPNSLSIPLSSANPSDTELLNDLEQTAWNFFKEQREDGTGLVPDRARTTGERSNNAASIATTGFGLAATCVAESRGWIDHETALQQCRETTRFALEKVSHEHGFFYHFLDLKKGTPAWECEASPIDTALFLSGAMCAREYFNDPELTELVNTIRDRVDWQWMLNGGKNLALGWTPKEGFLPYRWDNYSEHMVMDLMGIGAVTKSLPTETWGAWKRTPVGTHDGMTFMESPPLFTHQYSQAFVDFREKTDGRLDYFLNSRYATLAQRSMCIAMQKTFPEWGENVWGITASDSAHGYIAWGGPPLTGPLDGTIVPCAPGGSIPFAPEECLSALREMKKRWGEKIWGRYGFADAFNPHNGWVDSDVIGIDVGITLLQAENYRTGLIWKTFMRSPEIKKAMEAVGFGPSQELMAHSSFVKYETLAH